MQRLFCTLIATRYSEVFDRYLIALVTYLQACLYLYPQGRTGAEIVFQLEKTTPRNSVNSVDP